MDADPPLTVEELASVEAVIDDWLAERLADDPVVAAVERDPGAGPNEWRWFVRVLGEDKDVSTLWFTLRQRMLHVETYVMPAPEDNAEAFWEHLLRRNRRLVGVTFCIGEEDAVFLVGAVPAETVDDDTLDRILGTVWTAIEQCFRSALRLGFARRLGGLQ